MLRVMKRRWIHVAAPRRDAHALLGGQFNDALRVDGPVGEHFHEVLWPIDVHAHAGIAERHLLDQDFLLVHAHLAVQRELIAMLLLDDGLLGLGAQCGWQGE